MTGSNSVLNQHNDVIYVIIFQPIIFLCQPESTYWNPTQHKSPDYDESCKNSLCIVYAVLVVSLVSKHKLPELKISRK